MSPPRLDIDDSDSNIDGDLDPGPQIQWDLVLQKFQPHLENEADIPKLKERLDNLGVKTVSDLSLLSFSEDLAGILKPVQCRRMEAELAKDHADSSSSNNNRETSSTAPHSIEVTKLFSPNFLEILNGSERLSNSDRLKFVRGVADQVHDTYRPVTMDICQRVASVLNKQFKTALASKFHDSDTDDLATRIMRHVRYVQKLHKKRHSSDEVHHQDPKRRFSVRENYGICSEKDLPNTLPDGETANSQKLKQSVMQTMATSGEIDWSTVKKLMKETYTSQRASIAAKLNMEEILILWPFIGKNQILRNHFYTLMNLKEEDCINTISELCPKMMKFFRAEANIRRKGRAGEATKNILKILKHYDCLEQESASMELVAVTLLLGERMGQNMSKLFLYFDETTSFDEVQASPKLPDHGKPIIAVLGNDVLQNPSCFVIVEKRCISTYPVKVCHAIILAFMAYFVFKITYPTDLCALLEFLQRSVFKINVKDSKVSRVERRKSEKGWHSNPPPVSSKYLTLMREFEDYCALWDLK